MEKQKRCPHLKRFEEILSLLKRDDERDYAVGLRFLENVGAYCVLYRLLGFDPDDPIFCGIDRDNNYPPCLGILVEALFETIKEVESSLELPQKDPSQLYDNLSYKN